MTDLVNIVGFVFLVTTTIIGLTALIMLNRAVFPALIERTRANVIYMPRRAFLVGLVNSGFFGLISVGLLSAGEGAALLGLIVAAILLAFISVGLSAIADLIGERLSIPSQLPLLRTLVGAITLQLAALTPLVGWMVVPFIAGLLGYGALIIALVQRRPNTRIHQEEKVL